MTEAKTDQIQIQIPTKIVNLASSNQATEAS